MRRGPWYQFGDRSQLMVMEQLENGGHGVGVIISPRDLAPHKAEEYATKYHELGADLLIDQQFYIPNSKIGKLSLYPIARFRKSVSKLGKITDSALNSIANELSKQHTLLAANGVIAPAVVYEAGRPDITALNARLFKAAQTAGNTLGIPTYATVVLGKSVTASDSTMAAALSQATSLNCNGWYFAFEFDEPRIPTDPHRIRRSCEAVLKLACTGQPVLHAYAGPMSLLSHASGATGAGIGHSQNLWQFTLDRWQPGNGGGGGDAPPRFFSRSLWGTIVYSDEIAPLPQKLRKRIITHSPYSSTVATAPPYTPWNRWDANKHLLHIICETVDKIAKSDSARDCASKAMVLLDNALSLHNRIQDEDLELADNTDNYQHVWRTIIETVLDQREEDYDYLDLL